MHDGSDDDEFLIRGKQGAKSAGCMYIREFGTGDWELGSKRGLEKKKEKNGGVYIFFFIFAFIGFSCCCWGLFTQ